MAGLAMASLMSLPAWAETGGIADPTQAWNELWESVVIDLLIIGGIFGIAAIYMLIRYRAKSPDEVGKGPKLTAGQAWAFAIIPAAIFLADDLYLSAKGWSLWNIQRRVPDNAMEVKVTGNQWYFEYEYEGGVTSDELVVPVGQPVVLRMTSNDVIHSFGLTEYRLKEDMMPGRVTYIWFYPKEEKTTNVVCVEFCGNSHSEMYSAVRVIPRKAFDAWYEKAKKEAALKRNRLAAKKGVKDDSAKAKGSVQ